MKKAYIVFGTIVALLVAGSVMAYAATSQVQANTAEQEQSQELKVKCETGSYGQNSYCEAEGKQEQKQKIEVTNGRVLGKTHNVVDTSLDLQTSAVAGMSMLSGVGAFIAKRKLG